ncbi:MAG: hypothetical protein K8J31_02475, partial [Anaerolineae bacterium]|nr:hypothetical protein [Anaerolineae bacterium]
AAEDDRNQVALRLLTPGEADGFIERLYQHARTHHIEITNLQAQQTTQMAETGVYELRTFRLQAEGDAHDLMDAIADMEALAVPGVAMDEISIVHNPGGVLLMTLSIYASPYGAGKLDDALPRLTGESVLVPPTPAAPVEILAAGQADVEMTAEPVDCPGAQPSPFHAGDTVVVDFSSVGALRILERASGVDTLTQVYDGTSLRLLDGPVCGTWHGEKILYWHVDYNGLQGWAGEGDSQDRWMCALANPDCS